MPEPVFTGHHQHQHRFLSQRHPHNFFSHQIYHSSSGRWAVGVTFGQNPHFQRPHSRKKLGLICDKVRVAFGRNHPSFFLFIRGNFAFNFPGDFTTFFPIAGSLFFVCLFWLAY